jgi:hypothetical protein
MMEISTALDLCAGKGGWCRGLKAAGWKTIAVDIEDWKNPWADRFILADIRRFYPSQHNLGKISLVCASPPCQEFSYKSFPFKRCKDAPPPDRSIWLACERIAQELGAPLVLENVQGARKYMGPASAHYGSFYLWGDVPALLPIGRPQKGFGRVKEMDNPTDHRGGFGGTDYQVAHPKGETFAPRRTRAGFAGEMDRVKPVYRGPQMSNHCDKFKRMAGREKYRRIHGAEQARHHGSRKRKEWSAQVAMIPLELAEWIGQCFYPHSEKGTHA